MASTLLGSVDHRLPNELTLAVVQHLAHDHGTLCTLAQTCRGFQQLAEEHIYKTIKLRSVRDLQRIISAFVARHDRVRAVHTLEILYRYNEHLDVSLERRRAFNECVAQMVNLRNWHIESPYDNFKWENGGHEWVEGDMERFRQALERACVEGAKEKARFALNQSLWKSMRRTVGLAQLQSLTIHSHGARADFWELGEFHCLFRHPSLRHLHVSCVTLPETLDVLEPHRNTTPLTTLIFDECNLHIKSLRQILGTPEKLKNLTLGENIFNINRSQELSPRLSPDPVAALEAIAPVAHSLESLTHLDSKWRIHPGKFTITRKRITGEGMRHFRFLKTMECDTESFLHESIIMNPELCPPNLDTLIVRRHYYVAEDFFDYLPDVGIYTVLPSLNTLDLRQSAVSLATLATAEYICHPERLRSRHAYGYTLSKRDINFRVSIELGRGSSLIPPYLHGEPVPEVHCLYDASLVGFRRRIVDEPTDPKTRPGENHALFPGHIVSPFHPFRADNAPAPASIPSPFPADPSTPTPPDDDLPETDQLSDDTVRQMTNATHRTLESAKKRFKRRLRLDPLLVADDLAGASADDSDVDNESDSDSFGDSSGGEDSDLDAMLADLQNDGDEEAFLHFLQHMQEQGIEVELESGGESGDDEDDGEWHDAEEGLIPGMDEEDILWEDAENDLSLNEDLD